ncbi:MAG: hypothetical protein EXR99_10915 [Gemmataceae bacterium]|nr:hypothetical protein [Gemmataceae bacterium]
MAEKKAFLLRLEPELHRVMQRWADDELRSLNGQMEYALRLALKNAGRRPREENTTNADPHREK